MVVIVIGYRDGQGRGHNALVRFKTRQIMFHLQYMITHEVDHLHFGEDHPNPEPSLVPLRYGTGSLRIPAGLIRSQSIIALR